MKFLNYVRKPLCRKTTNCSPELPDRSQRDNAASLLAPADGNNSGKRLKLHVRRFRLDLRMKFVPRRVRGHREVGGVPILGWAKPPLSPTLVKNLLRIGVLHQINLPRNIYLIL